MTFPRCGQILAWPTSLFDRHIFSRISSGEVGDYLCVDRRMRNAVNICCAYSVRRIALGNAGGGWCTAYRETLGFRRCYDRRRSRQTCRTNARTLPRCLPAVCKLPDVCLYRCLSVAPPGGRGSTSKNYVICVCFLCHGTSSYHTTNSLQGRRAKSHVDTQTIQPGLGDFVL